MPSRVLNVTVTVGMLSGIAGCNSPDALCAPVITEGQIPARAAPGDTIDLELANLVLTCNDQGQGPSGSLAEVEVELVSVDTAETVVATGHADVAEDATAVVRLTIPDEARGTFSVEYDGVSLGTVTVSG